MSKPPKTTRASARTEARTLAAEAPAAPPTVLPGRTRALFWLATLLIPVLFFALLEAGKVLDDLIENASLENATREALDAIGDLVGVEKAEGEANGVVALAVAVVATTAIMAVAVT